MKAILKMRTYKFGITAVFILFLWGNVFAQNKSVLNFNYSLSLLMDSEDDIGASSVKGFSLEGRTFISDQVTIGEF